MSPATDTSIEPARLGGRLEGTEAVRAIKRLQHAWGHYADAGDYAAMADLFADHGCLILPPHQARGRDAILALLVQAMGGGDADPAPDRLNVRLQLSPVVTIGADGMTGKGRWHELALTGSDSESAEWSGGIQENEYVREGGVWKIAVLHHHPQFAGPHAIGWRSVSADVPLVPFHFTPDQAGTPIPDRAAPEIDAGALASRAQRLVDENLVQNLLAAYGFYTDRRLWDDVGDLFAEDGVLQEDGEQWSGRAAIRLGLQALLPAGLRRAEFFDHLQLMPAVDISSDGATARVRSIELQSISSPGSPDRWGVRVCEGEFRRTASGWCITSLRLRARLRAEHARGWHVLPWQPAASGGSGVGFAHPVRGERVVPAAAAAASLDDARRALAVAEAFDGAENVACAYGYYLDEAQWDATADLFARDGWKELSFIGTFIGRERIRDSLVGRYGRRPRRPTFLPIHQKTQPYVTVDAGGERARIRMKMLQVNSGWDAEAGTVAGVYEEQIVREDGIWRIHGMDLEYIVVMQWAGGWSAVTADQGRRFAPTPEAIAAFDPAPDAPLRGLAFAPFPEIGPLGFHFANPVSGRAPALRFEWSDGRFDSASGIPTTDMTRKASHDR